jgi:two-component system NarL family sensor kinase
MATPISAPTAPSYPLPAAERAYAPRAESPDARGERRVSFLEDAVRRMLRQPNAAAGRAEFDAVFAQINDTLAEGLAICNARGEVVFVNAKLCSMLERSAAELVGATGTAVLGELYERCIDPRAHPQRLAYRRFEAELSAKSGRTLVVDVTSRPLEQAQGECVGRVLVLTDISQRANALQRSESELRLLSAQFLAAQELERQRIARELHDGIGQALGGIKFGLETCEALIGAGAPQHATVASLQQLALKVRCVLEEVRCIAMNLRPSTLDDLGVLPTIGWFAREFRTIYKELDLETIVELSEEDIAPHTKTAVYRIVQEALNNVAAHAKASKVSLRLRRRSGHVELQVCDDGAGFDPAQFSIPDQSGRGLGLASMRERAEATGACYRLDARPGRGTTLRVSWPAPQHRRQHA